MLHALDQGLLFVDADHIWLLCNAHHPDENVDNYRDVYVRHAFSQIGTHLEANIDE